MPGYRYLVSWKDLYATYGDFTDFTDNVVGSYGFVGELFIVESETYRPPPKPGAAGGPAPMSPTSWAAASTRSASA